MAVEREESTGGAEEIRSVTESKWWSAQTHKRVTSCPATGSILDKYLSFTWISVGSSPPVPSDRETDTQSKRCDGTRMIHVGLLSSPRFIVL